MDRPIMLNSEDVYELSSFEDCVAAVRDAYSERGEGSPAKPRTTLTRNTPSGHLKGYMTLLPETGVMGGYLYSTGFTSQETWNVLSLFDAESGRLLALLDAASLNPVKTGAVGAVGTDALAREGVRSIGVFGSGKQAKGQLLALATVRDFNDVRVYSPTEAHRETFASKLSEILDAEVVPVNRSRDVVENSEVIITATNSDEPVFDGEYFQSGTHVTAIGQYHPDKRELDTTTITQSKYVPDLVERAHQDAGSYLIPKRAGKLTENHIHTELGKVLCGRIPGRVNDSEITVFDSGGTAIETVAAGYVIYKKAVDQDMGTEMEFGPSSTAPGRDV